MADWLCWLVTGCDCAGNNCGGPPPNMEYSGEMHLIELLQVR